MAFARHSPLYNLLYNRLNEYLHDATGRRPTTGCTTRCSNRLCNRLLAQLYGHGFFIRVVYHINDWLIVALFSIFLSLYGPLNLTASPQSLIMDTILPWCCLNCTKFGKLIFGKIIKIVATMQMSYCEAKMQQIRFWLGPPQTSLMGEHTELHQTP